MTLYPRSFLRLILLAWALVVLPLLAAIGYVSLSLNSLAVRSEGVVLQATQTAQLSRELPEQLIAMERTLRQYEVLKDSSLAEDYAALRADWRRRADDLLRMAPFAGAADTVRQMLAREARAYARFVAAPGEARPLRDVIVDNKAATHRLLVDAGRQLDADREAFRRELDGLRDRLLLALALAMLLAALMFLLGRRIVARLLSRVERAVIALGRNRLERTIRLKGPEDVQMIGRRLDWLRRRLLALEQQRTRVLRHVSHELKTPLAALREGASLLNEGLAGPLTPKQAKIAGIMKGNAIRLQGLIDGLLRMQQAGHMRDRFETAAVRLDDLVQQVLSTHQLAARNKKLHVSGSLAPLVVEGGREELTTIVDNLVSNAIKFSPEGATVTITLTRDGDSAVLDVKDQGPGVADAEREKVFEPFYRSPASRSVAGVGLGLAIAREFAAAHRGTLELRPGAGGAHLRAVLPLAGEAP